MGIDVNQWRATIGLWHVFMVGRPLIRRRLRKPSGIRERKLHQTRSKNHFLSFVLLLTLLIVLSSRSNGLNKLQCRLTAAYILPPVRLVSVLLLVASEKFESIDKRRSTGTEHLSLISPNFIVPILAMLLILAGDVELNPGPFKLVPFTNLAFICSLLLLTVTSAVCSNLVGSKLKNGDSPSLPVLRHFPVNSGFKDIAAEIQNNHEHFGTLLLKDTNGNVVKGIVKASNGNPVDITVEILRQWLEGKGKLPVTWQTLIKCLRDAKLNVAADSIEGALFQESSSDVSVSSGSFTGQQLQPKSPTEGIIPMLLGLVFGGILMACIMIKMGYRKASTESKSVVFARENREVINSKFAEFQTKVCDKLFENNVNIRQFRLFAKNQFSPGDCIPPPPASLIDIFEAITSNGLWDCLHYSPLVHIVETFGANDPEMEDWVQNYEKDLKAYSIVTTVEDYIETALNVADPSPANIAKYDRHYYCPVEWKTNFVDHSLKYLTEVWKLFSCRYLVPDSPPTAILDRIHKGCFVVTWLVPSHLIPPLIKRIKNDTEFFQQHCILKVTVGEECAYEEATEKSALEPGDVAVPVSLMQVAQKKENQKHEFNEEEMEQAKETGVGAVAKPVPVVEVAHSTKNRRKQKPKLYQEETGHSKTTMNLFWIAGIISIAVLIYFMDPADFGFNILNGTYEQVLYWLRGERYMEKYLQGVTRMKFFWIMTTGTILIAVLIYFKMSVVFAFNQTETEYMEEVLLVWSTNKFHEGLRPGLDDRDDVLQILTNADKKWHNIGLQLGLSKEELSHINANYRPRQERLCKTVDLWLQGVDPIPTWEGLVVALKSQTVKEYHLAKIVEENYCNVKVKYSDYLRRFYRNLAPQRMLQWPELPHYEFVTLALIKKGRVTFHKKMDEFVQSTLHGNTDDILRQKEEIYLEQIFDKVEVDHKLVLVEGAPGAGKTMLVWHICREWGRNKLFTQFSIIILATLRDPAVQGAKSLTDVLLLTCENRESAQKESSIIKACHGRGVLFLLDGWDELPEEQKQKEKLFFHTLIENPEMLSLDEAAIIITSRPVSSGDLRKFVSLRVEIVGFTSSNIKKYFETCLKSEREHSTKLDKLYQIVADNPLIGSICYLPLNAAIIVYLFCACDYTLPSTYHELFQLLVYHCIIRYAEKSHVNLQHQDVTFEGLPEKIRKPFEQICKLAYLATKKNVMTFSSDTLCSFEATEPLNHLGLMQSVKTLHIHGKGTTYHFLHLSLQELLAAYHISKITPDARQVEVFEDLVNNPRFSTVFGFYAGFTKFKKEGFRDVLARIVQSERQKLDDKTLLVSLMNWLYEAQDAELCHFVQGELNRDQSGNVTGENGVLDLSYTTLQPSDTLSVGYFLGTAKKHLHANLSCCSIKDHHTRFLVKGLSCCQSRTKKASVEMNLSMNNIHAEGLKEIADFLQKSTPLKALSLGQNKLSHSNVPPLMKALTKNSSLTKLDLSQCSLKLTGEAGESLRTMLIRNKSLVFLDISYSTISSKCIADGLVQNRGLKILHMKYCNITPGGMRQISEAIQKSKLEELSIGPLKDDCIESLINALSSLRSLILRGTEVTDRGLQILGDALQENNSLIELSLWDFKCVTSDGLKILGEQLKRNQTLEVLALRLIGRNPIDGLKHLVKCLQTNSTLSSLKLLDKHKPELKEIVCNINKMRQLPLKLETYSD